MTDGLGPSPELYQCPRCGTEQQVLNSEPGVCSGCQYDPREGAGSGGNDRDD